MPHQCTFDLIPSHIADGMPLRRSFRSLLKKASLSDCMHLGQLPYFLSPNRPNDNTFVYIDDVAVFSNSWDEHKYHLVTVFDVLWNAGQTIQTAKAQLATTSCVFLGQRVGGGYISPHGLRFQQFGTLSNPGLKRMSGPSSDSLTIIEDSFPTSRPYLHHSQISYSSTNLILWIGLKIVRQPSLIQSRPYALPLY